MVTVCVSKPHLDLLIPMMSRILCFLNGAGTNKRRIRSRSSLIDGRQTNPDPVHHLSTSPVLLQSYTNYIHHVIVLQSSGSDVTDNNNGGS